MFYEAKKIKGLGFQGPVILENVKQMAETE